MVRGRKFSQDAYYENKKQINIEIFHGHNQVRIDLIPNYTYKEQSKIKSVNSLIL